MRRRDLTPDELWRFAPWYERIAAVAVAVLLVLACCLEDVAI